MIRERRFDINLYKNKKVFVTGHTGFKGTWLCRLLINAGADVTGFALGLPTSPSLFEIAGIEHDMRSVIGDIRNLGALRTAFDETRPEIVFHLAAQPIVRESYRNPVFTYETNVLGTVNMLECVRTSEGVKSVINVTTDKVYRNQEWVWGYRESDELGGNDCYSGSKACSELVTSSYKSAFLTDRSGSQFVSVSTARAGNVIGGGDFADSRVIPDCVRAAIGNGKIIVRNPHSVRPYQHVLDPLYAYIMIAAKQYEERRYAGSYNIGPDDADCYTTGELVEMFVSKWGKGLTWVSENDGGPHEASFLKLDSSKIKATFGWNPRWNLETAVEKTVEWSKHWQTGGDVLACMDMQISDFFHSGELQDQPVQQEIACL